MYKKSKKEEEKNSIVLSLDGWLGNFISKQCVHSNDIFKEL